MSKLYSIKITPAKDTKLLFTRSAKQQNKLPDILGGISALNFVHTPILHISDDSSDKAIEGEPLKADAMRRKCT